MGLTIHYKTKFEGKEKEVQQKLEKLRIIAVELGFKEVSQVCLLDYSKHYDDFTENMKQAHNKDLEIDSYRWMKIQYREYDKKELAKVKGFCFMAWFGEGCEATNIGLVSNDGINWKGGAFTKTQYAKEFIKAHLSIIALLDGCKELGILETVSDEGNYWESRNLEELGESINSYSVLIGSISKILKEKFGQEKITAPIDETKNFVEVKKRKRI